MLRARFSGVTALVPWLVSDRPAPNHTGTPADVPVWLAIASRLTDAIPEPSCVLYRLMPACMCLGSRAKTHPVGRATTSPGSGEIT
jgi:hypothetical protein